MYKVFLVDDEELVIKSLIASINWNEYGFEIVGYALGGIEAYTKILEINPDIVFTDIRMPGISGLELIKGIRETNQRILFIVVSGYAEFAYAQKALNYGALGYCLKPFDDIEIAGYLKKARAALDSFKAPSETDLMDLIADDSELAKDSLEKELSKYGIEINTSSNSNKFFILVCIGKEKLKIQGLDIKLTLKIGYDKYAYFISGNRDSFFDQYKEEIASNGIKGIGSSREIEKAKGIQKAIQEAEIKAYHYFTSYNDNAVPLASSLLQDKNNAIVRLDEAMARNDIKECMQIMDNITAMFSDGQLNIKHAMIVYNKVMAFTCRLENEQYEDYIYSYDRLAGLFSDVYEMIIYLKKLLEKKDLDKKSTFAVQKTSNHTFKTILKYVNENFCGDISTQSLSKAFNVNAGYISQLFKREVGITFTEYLTKLRMDFACNLLKTTSLSISEISEKCGYNDFFYFSRLFKKINGMAPSGFRNS